MPDEQLSPEQIKQQCIFCHIVEGSVASKKVFEDEKCIGVLDINPANAGHVLLIPKEHYAIMPQLPDEIIGHLGQVSNGISIAMLKSFKADGTTTFIANGMAAGQRAQHFMMHIIPRQENDGVGMLALDGKPVSDEMLTKVQEAVQASIKKILGFEIPKIKPFPRTPHTEGKASLDDIATLLEKK